MKKLLIIALMTMLALTIKNDIMMLLWFVITTRQALKLAIR